MLLEFEKTLPLKSFSVSSRKKHFFRVIYHGSQIISIQLEVGHQEIRGGTISSSGQSFEFPLGGFDEPNQQGGQSTSPWEPVAFVIQDRSGSISISDPVCGDITISAIASGRALAALDDTLAFACSPRVPKPTETRVSCEV